jgi:formylmethanofuran dehydrogenase subunit B
VAEAGIGPVTCAGCGLLCDDVTLDRSGDAVRLRPACALGARWFTERVHPLADAPGATIDGDPAEVEAALARAAELLRRARRPMLYGFEGSTVEDARAAVALADRLGALVMSETVTGPWPGAAALALRGATTATLGEVRDRSRVVAVWREDPEATHPRLLERLGFGAGAPAPSRAPARSSAQRTLVVIDDRDTRTADRATLRLTWPRERDLEALVTLHALTRAPASAPAPSDLDAPLRALMEHIENVPHVAFVHGPGLTGGDGGQRRALALNELTRALSHERHVVTLALPRATGTVGAQDALAWQTGYAGNVDFASGHPELLSTTQPLEEAEGIDVAVRIDGARARLAPGVAEIALCSVPADEAEPDPAVSIRIAAAGVEAGGTAHRFDGVPLALQAPWPADAPTAAAVLTRLLAEVAR